MLLPDLGYPLGVFSVISLFAQLLSVVIGSLTFHIQKHIIVVLLKNTEVYECRFAALSCIEFLRRVACVELVRLQYKFCYQRSAFGALWTAIRTKLVGCFLHE